MCIYIYIYIHINICIQTIILQYICTQTHATKFVSHQCHYILYIRVKEQVLTYLLTWTCSKLGGVALEPKLSPGAAPVAMFGPQTAGVHNGSTTSKLHTVNNFFPRQSSSLTKPCPEVADCGSEPAPAEVSCYVHGHSNSKT